MIARIMNLSKGNPGAMTFLMGLLEKPDGHSITIFHTLEKTGIKGTDIYVLWSDLCDKDTKTVAALCNNCPADILIDACSRQDYSGRELVREYIS